MSRKRIGLLFGGRSAEHDVSIMSATRIYTAIDPEKYEVMPIGIARDGTWFLLPLVSDKFPEKVSSDGIRIALLPGGHGRFISVDTVEMSVQPFDVMYPVLHGPFGEDGSIQGAFEMAGVPYVGCDVLSSAVAMDKDFTKRLLRNAGIPTNRYEVYYLNEPMPEFAKVSQNLGLPLFVKPACLGSSVGIGKVQSAEEFNQAIAEAFKYDSKILIEEFVLAREIECGVLESNGQLLSSVVGEVTKSDNYAFYDYQAKYIDKAGSSLSVPAKIPEQIAEQIRSLAIKVFQILNCRGLARIDFFLSQSMQIYVNEVNTMPGFTHASLFPAMFESSGIVPAALVSMLIEQALQSHHDSN